MSVIIVLCEKENIYKRFVGKNMTHKVRAEFPMNQSEVEQFRVDPDSMIDPDSPEAA